MKDSPVDWRRSKVTVVDDLLDVKKVQPAADQTPAGVVVVRNDTHMIMRVSREKSQRQKKGQPAAAKGGGKKGQPAAAKGGRIHGMGKASGSSLEEPASGGGKGLNGFGGHHSWRRDVDQPQAASPP